MKKLWQKLKALAATDQPEHLRRGQLGERAAKAHLQARGLKFLTANFRSTRGEIDLVFRDDDCLLFVLFTRNIFQFENADAADERAVVAFANPAFSLPSATAGNRPESTPMAALSPDHRSYDGLALHALPGTEQEIQFLKQRAHDWKLLQKEFVGNLATEAELNAVRSPFILHLATHGFFLPEKATEGGSKINPRTAGANRASVVLLNPMQRSGLALAGAKNTLDAWKQGLVPPPENDGILSAQEVGSLNLQNT